MNTLRDPLTNAYTREALNDRLSEEIGRALRHELPFSLMVVDLDHFKSINDAFGHLRGDQALMHLATCFREVLRRSDLLFRYGGDEFVVLLPNTPKGGAVVIAERLLHTIHNTPVPGEPPLILSLSVGVADLSEEAQTPEDLFELADSRAYQAKRSGRARVMAESLPGPDKLSFESDTRLIERDEAFERVRQFLRDLPAKRNGVLAISGPPGSGRTRLLAEVGKLARLQGYTIWPLATGPGLRLRAYGSITETEVPFLATENTDGAEGGRSAHFAHTIEKGLDTRPSVVSVPSVATLSKLIQERLAATRAAGLLIVADRLADVDQSTLALLRELLVVPNGPLIALAYTADAAQPAPIFALAHQESITLEPWSALATRLWLRGVLRWEPPDDFVAWLHEAAEGLPGLLRARVRHLVANEALVHAAQGWQWLPELADRPLKERPAPSLPSGNGEFVGREEELHSLKQHLREQQAVIIIGPGGMGKSRLAAQVGWELSDQFADGVFCVDLSALTRNEQFYPTLAVALNIALNNDETPEEQVLSQIGERQMLLIIDSAEQLSEDSNALSQLIQAAPATRLLITSREPIALPTALVVQLGGFAIRPVLAGSSLLALFVQAARRTRADYMPREDDLPLIAQIARQVAGMPLGLELAAAWVPFLGCAAVAESIGRSLDMLSTARADLPERQRGMRAVFDSLWHQLMADEQAALAGLAVFRGGFRSPAAEQVAGARSFFLAALVSRAVLSQSDEGRLVLNELLRQYAEEQLKAMEGAYGAARRAHLAYYLTFAEEQAYGAEEAAQRYAALHEEQENLRVALAWALVMRPATALRLALALSGYWVAYGLQREGRRWLNEALNATGNAADAHLRTRAREVLARM
jgi:diguanylate cyclase (GGDEF)-like protein